MVLLATVMFFLLKMLDVQDLEQIPWNIILLFGGAMSLGSCLIETGAAEWLAVHCVGILGGLPPAIALVVMLVPVLIVTNLVLNVATVALCLPVILRAAPLLGLGSEVVLYSILAVTGMPFLFLIGAAPNAIAFESKQFTQKEFVRTGSVASLILLGWMLLMITVIWPAMGVEVVTGRG
jgi:sodium-dependent dicarboxylate transporter 2/3/5